MSSFDRRLGDDFVTLARECAVPRKKWIRRAATWLEWRALQQTASRIHA